MEIISGAMEEPYPNISSFNNNAMGRKKSNVRLNDQLIPKPTDINVAEKMIKICNLKEHPYSSHIPRVALFPSFHSPDDPETGVRAASKAFHNLLIPTRAPDVTVLSKTIGSPYRHETLATPGKTPKKAVSWTGENGFLDHTKPLKGKSQVFYPTPPKVLVPNPKLRGWDLTLSERTSNMLKNLERTLWVTSYQMHYTGSGPANPLKTDNYLEKINNLTGINAHPAPLKERSHPTFVPSKPHQGCGMKQGSKVERSTCSPTAARLQNKSSAVINQHRLQETTENEGKQREKCKVCFDETLMTESNTEQRLDQNNQPHFYTNVSRERSHTMWPAKDLSIGKEENLEMGVRSRTSAESYAGLLSEQQVVSDRREHLHGVSNPCILPPTPVQPGIDSADRARSVDRASNAFSLLELQQSFNKSEAHRNFNNSITHVVVDLRDNIVSGRKHNFYGINCHYIRG